MVWIVLYCICKSIYRLNEQGISPAFGNGAAARGDGVEVRRSMKREMDWKVGFVNSPL